MFIGTIKNGSVVANWLQNDVANLLPQYVEYVCSEESIVELIKNLYTSICVDLFIFLFVENFLK